MSIDKFLTDLAAHAGVHTVQVEHAALDYVPASMRFSISLFSHVPGACIMDKGEGESVDIALAAALAAKTARLALDGLIADDADLIEGLS